MTLKDIAKQAGVSVSTVSRILNDKDTKSASAEVRKRVWEIIRDTGYVPDTNARNLRNASAAKAAKSKMPEKKYFACVYARSSDSNDLFFAELAKAIEYEAYKKGYILKLSLYANELDEKSFLTAIKDQDISGFAILGRFANDYADCIMSKQRNVVYVGLNPIDTNNDTIFCDGHRAAILAVKSLLDMGHSEIAYIGETTKENRFAGYKEVFLSRGNDYNRQLVVDSKQTLEGGYQGAEKLCSRNVAFSAIFCANDSTAMGCIKFLRETKVKVPEQVSVISIDDIEMSRYFMPMLTTIHIPVDELGKQAAKMLIDRIEKGHSLPVRLELPFSLMKRDSCAPKGRNNK